ncbi:MAG: class I SAM-dependent methyltransferase [Anaerolineales bacterium]|nr:class I SAM-dependent methyltransferase [Anaerolineales bacterium]
MKSAFIRFRYSILYRFHSPWDTGIPAPELVRTIAGLAPGRAIDLGCGTGTNLLYLAEHGWEITGVDFIGRALAAAKRKLGSRPAAWLQADVTNLERMRLPGPYDLALDMGCFHSLNRADRARYARGLGRWMKPEGLFLLYAWQPENPGDTRGVSREDVTACFAADFHLYQYEQGAGHPSAWYYFKRRKNPAP